VSLSLRSENAQIVLRWSLRYRQQDAEYAGWNPYHDPQVVSKIPLNLGLSVNFYQKPDRNASASFSSPQKPGK
jgi:hypothetical protein